MEKAVRGVDMSEGGVTRWEGKRWAWPGHEKKVSQHRQSAVRHVSVSNSNS